MGKDKETRKRETKRRRYRGESSSDPHYSLFIVHCSLPITHCPSFIVHYLLFIAHSWSLQSAWGKRRSHLCTAARLRAISWLHISRRVWQHRRDHRDTGANRGKIRGADDVPGGRDTKGNPRSARRSGGRGRTRGRTGRPFRGTSRSDGPVQPEIGRDPTRNRRVAVGNRFPVTD